jgi:nucleoid-associated protein YgaU
VARVVHRLRSVLALAVVLALVVGVPTLLAFVAGWPLPRRFPDWDRVSTALRQGDIPGDVVVKALAVLVWIAWAQVAWAVVWELVVNVPRVNHGQRPQPAPLVPAAMGNGVGRLVALVLSIGITLASTPTPLLARPAAGVAALPRQSSMAALTVDAPPRGNVAAAEQTRSWQVLDGDSLWDIADTALGDGSRSSEIIDLNWQLRSPRDVRPGQLLRLPADATVPPDRTPRPAAAVDFPSDSHHIFPGAQGEFPETVAETVQPVRAAVGAAAAAPSSVPARAAAIVDAGDVASTPGSTQPSAPPDATPPLSAIDNRDVVAVQSGNSAWSIADAHLGDGMRWRELWELNHGVVQADGRAWNDPQELRVGWLLKLPSATGETPQAAPPPVASEATADPVTTIGARTYTVERGDSLTRIAREQLGDPTRYREIFDLNRGVDQPDGRHLTDPNLIVTGWQLQLPNPSPSPMPTPTPPATPPPAPPSTTPDAPPTTLPPPPTTPPVMPPPATAPPPGPAPTTATTAAPSVSPPTVVARPPEPFDPTTNGHAGADGRDHDGDIWSSTAPLLIGVSGAVVLATGILGRLRWLRRRQATRSRPNRPDPDSSVDAVDRAVVAAADVPLVRWAGQSLAALCTLIDARRVDGVPLAVELSEEAGIELLWDRPQPDVPVRWIPADGGWAWNLDYDPETSVPVDDLPAALPGLVTVGVRDGRQLLVNLEAFGTLFVNGDPGRVDDFLRAVTVEFASGDELSDAYVHTVNVDVEVGLTRLHQCPDDLMADRIGSIAASVTAALAAAATATSFAYRSGTDAGHLEINVFVATGLDPAAVSTLAAAAPANRGVVVIVGSCDPPGTGGARLVIGPDGLATLEPLGVTFVAAGLPATTSVRLQCLLDDAAVIDDGVAEQLSFDGPSVAEVTLDTVGAESTGAVSSNGDPDATHGSPLDAQLIVRVLGIPRVPDRPNLRRRETILTAFLACRGGPVNASAVQDALWNGQAVQGKTLWNLVGATRTALGQLPDGTWVLPPSDRNRRMQALADGVTTDLAILRFLCDLARHVSSSEAIGLLQQGLALVDGPPFDADGYDWAHHGTQYVAEASALIEQAVDHLVNLTLDVDDVPAARDAIRLGLRGLPGHEVLYRLRMRVEHHAGNLSGIAAAFDELVQYLAEFETVPSPATVELHRDLVRPIRT